MKRTRDEAGAVAVVVAVMASVLLGVAALTVDLGDSWARKRQVQTQVDVVALAAGAYLPMTTANRGQIAQAAADYFNKDSNRVAGQPASDVTGAQLLDGSDANGEIYFPDANTLRLVAPFAKVGFGLASALPGNDDPSSVQVTREATVQLRTPLPKIDAVLPMWLPGSCMYGETTGDAGSSTSAAASPKFTLATPRGNHGTGTLSPATATYGTTVPTVSVPIDKIPAGKTGATIRFTFGDGKIVDKPVTWTTQTTNNDTRTVTVSLGSEITGTAGDWQVWPLITNTTTPRVPPNPLPNPLTGVNYPKNNGEGTFKVTGGGEVACSASVRGNFGQLDSPRAGVTQLQKAYALNVALGLDHKLVPFQNPSKYVCTADGNPVGALIDDKSEDGRNCLYVQPGNDPIGLTSGLLDADVQSSGHQGRLRASSTSPCGVATKNQPKFGSINNDTLSCYLKPGYTLADVAKDTGVPSDAFDATLLDSPRFFWVPVVYEGDRTEKKYLAIRTFVPAFLTDETRTSSRGHSDATTNNGLQMNGGGTQVESVQLFAFNIASLPIDPNADTVDYQGGRGVLRLIH